MEYTPVFDANPYIRSTVLIEVSGRSMREPVDKIPIRSYIDEVYTQAPFTEPASEVRAVVPQRTFLEKLFLLLTFTIRVTSMVLKNVTIGFGASIHSS